MKRKGRKLIFMLAMLASCTMLFGCVKKNSENTTATVETPTPTPTETPEATPTPTTTPEPTATPEETQTVVSAVEVEDEDVDEYDDNEYNDDTVSSSDNTSSDWNDNQENEDNSDNNANNDSNDSSGVNMNFADDYQAREELSDDEVGYGSENVPDASEPVAPGEGNQAMIASAVYVRSGPGTENEIIGSLSEGDTVVILGNEGGWLKINYGNKVGYFYQDYVALDW